MARITEAYAKDVRRRHGHYAEIWESYMVHFGFVVIQPWHISRWQLILVGSFRFVTFTANPHWKEFQELIPLYGQSITTIISQYPHIVGRIFMDKVAHFLHLLTKKHVLGEVTTALESNDSLFTFRSPPIAIPLSIKDADFRTYTFC